MRAYKEYMNNISVSEKAHHKFVSCVTNANHVNHKIIIRRYAVTFTCLALILLGVLTVPHLFRNDFKPTTNLPQLPGDVGSTIIESSSDREHGGSLSSAKIIDGSGYAQAGSSYKSPSPGNSLYFIEVQQAINEYSGTDTLLFLTIDLFSKEKPMTGRKKKVRLRLRGYLLSVTGLGIPRLGPTKIRGKKFNIHF